MSKPLCNYHLSLIDSQPHSGFINSMPQAPQEIMILLLIFRSLNPISISINSWQDSIRNRQEFTHIVRAALTSILNRMDCKTPYSRQNSPHILRTHPRGFPHSQRLQTRFPERAKRRTPGHTAPRYCGGGCRSKTS